MHQYLDLVGLIMGQMSKDLIKHVLIMVKHAQVFWTIETNTYQSHFMSNVWSLPINNLIA